MHGKNPVDIPAHGETGLPQEVDRLLDSTEIRAALGGISESTFRRISPELPLRRIGSRVYARVSELNDYIANLPRANQPAA